MIDAALRDYALVLGSNHRPARALRLALRRISERTDIVSCAPVLRTYAEDGGRYLNAALRIRSPLPPPALRETMHQIETEAGRQRGVSQVALDIDVVASRGSDGSLHLHKPDDLQRDYVRVLLAQIGFELL